VDVKNQAKIMNFKLPSEVTIHKVQCSMDVLRQ